MKEAPHQQVQSCAQAAPQHATTHAPEGWYDTFIRAAERDEAERAPVGVERAPMGVGDGVCPRRAADPGVPRMDGPVSMAVGPVSMAVGLVSMVVGPMSMGAPQSGTVTVVASAIPPVPFEGIVRKFEGP